MDILKLSLRYLKTRRMALLASVFLAIAVTAMIVVMSVMAGFQQRIRGHLRSVEPDLTIRLKARPLPSDTFERIEEELRGEMAKVGGPIHALAPRNGTKALLGSKVGRGSDGQGGPTHSNTVRLIAIDWERDYNVIDWSRALRAIKKRSPYKGLVPENENPFTWYPLGGILMSDSLALTMAFLPGDGPFSNSEASLVIGAFGTDDSGATVIKPSNRTFTLAGCFDTGRDDHDQTTVYMDLQDFRRLRYPGAADAPTATYAVARIADRSAAGRVASNLRARHPALDVETWEDRNSSLMTALSVEKTVTTLILLFVIMLAGLLLMGILYMIVIEKRRDIGILRSMGLSATRTIGVFVLYGSMLGIIGVVAGMAFGVLVVSNIAGITQWLADQWQIEIFDKRAYDNNSIPSVLSMGEVGIVGLVSFTVTVLAAGFAAFRAVKASPVENLRYE